MCGIAGVLGSDPKSVERTVHAMMSAQVHRGPDDAGAEVLAVGDLHLGLGHRRLAIQDLSPAGHQPMQNPETGSWIVFNGEIYNYPELRAALEQEGARFRSHCDTEAILYAYARWGLQALRRLRGMFAFALYTPSNRELLLARDPLGIKPLYFSVESSRLSFASELKAVTRGTGGERRLNRQAIAGLLAYGAVPSPLTMWDNIEQVEPGAFIRFDLSRPSALRPFRNQRYWDFPPDRPELSRQEAIEELSLRLKESIRSHLLGDVPIGIFLSSGIDSTLMAALSHQVSKEPINTFTVSLDDKLSDEGDVAAQTAKRLGAVHHHLRMDEARARSLTLDWFRAVDQPSVDGLNTFIISKAVSERKLVVALSGLGGDELFCGYSLFREVPRLLRLSRLARRVPRPLRRAAAMWAMNRKPPVQRRKAVDLALCSAELHRLYFHRRRLFSNEEMDSFGLTPGPLSLDESYLPEASQPLRAIEGRDPVSALRILESRFYMGNMLLRDSDVNGMAHSLEIRVPLLDTQVADWAYAIPGMLAQPHLGETNKPLLVAAAQGRIPPEVSQLSKRGFNLPYSAWMLGPLREVVEAQLHALKRSEIVFPSAVDAVWTEFLRSPQGPTWSRAWMLGVLGNWIQQQA